MVPGSTEMGATHCKVKGNGGHQRCREGTDKAEGIDATESPNLLMGEGETEKEGGGAGERGG